MRLLVVPLLALCTLAASGCMGDWYQFGDNSTGVHISADTGISASNLNTVAPFMVDPTGASITSSPAEMNGITYVTSDDGKLYAFDATGTKASCSGVPVTCSPLWQAAIQPSGAIATAGLAVSSSPALNSGTVLVGTLSNKLDAFDATGVTNCSGSPKVCTPLWTANLGGAVYGSVSILNNVAYVGDTSGKLSAFDATGVTNCSGSPKVCTPLWTASVGGFIADTPAVTNGVVYAGATNGKLYAFDAAGSTNCSGSPKVCTPEWTTAANAGISLSSPSVANGHVYVGAVDSKLYAYSATTGATQWSATTGGVINGSAAVANGTVWIGSNDSKLYAFNATTGAAQWTATTGGSVNGSPVFDNGLVYIGSGDGKVTAYDAAGVTGCSGSPKVCTAQWTATTGGAVNSGPIVAQGTLWYGSADHKLYAEKPWTYTNISTCDSTDPNGGLNPCQLEREYQLPSTVAGSGKTVAIVDAFDDPNVESDLAVYRTRWGLPACTTANGCFKKLNQSGVAGSYPTGDTHWGSEISLDVDAVSAICPLCHITLVEANSSGGGDLIAAEAIAAGLSPTAISNSWGGSEFSGESVYDSNFVFPGIATTVSSGDLGYETEWPASVAGVTSVGGTQLANPQLVRGWTEQAWGDGVTGDTGGGSGCSPYEPKPARQTDAGCGNRTQTDVSALGGYPGLLIYDTYGFSGYFSEEGTSLASPIVASVYALAGPVSSLATTYASTGTLNDSTAGANGACGSSYLCTAGVGYDGPTGLGTPCGTASFGTGVFATAASSCTAANGLPPSLRVLPALRSSGKVSLEANCPASKPGDMHCDSYRVVHS